MKLEEFKEELKLVLRYHLEFEGSDFYSSYIHEQCRHGGAVGLEDFHPIDLHLIERVVEDLLQRILKQDYIFIVKE